MVTTSNVERKKHPVQEHSSLLPVYSQYIVDKKGHADIVLSSANPIEFRVFVIPE